MLGQCKAFIKAVVAKFPILGWSMWFNEFVFLSRSKTGNDLSKIRKSMDHLRGELSIVGYVSSFKRVLNPDLAAALSRRNAIYETKT